MKKINGHNPAIDIPKATGTSRKPVFGKVNPIPTSKGSLLRVSPIDFVQPPLRGAKGDDDLRSEEHGART